MKIERVILEYFRCFYGKVEFSIDNFNVFIGKNDQGKSSILEAIDIFINEGKGVVKISSDDLNVRAQDEGKQEFRIGLVFRDFPEDIIVDATNPTTLKDEYLLNEEDYLEIWKTFRNGKLLGTFIRCYHPANDDFIKNLMNKRLSELKDFVNENNIRVDDKRKLADLRKGIRDFYKSKDGALNTEEIEIPVDAEGLKDIWSKLRNYLPVYALFHSDRKNVDQDDEIQDPLKIKIEEIFRREDVVQILNSIAEQIQKEIDQIAKKTIDKYKEISETSVTVKPNIPTVETLKWKDVYKGLGFVTDDEIPLNKRGSGLRRLILLSAFLADAEQKLYQDNVHIIYAVEEPEASLHPDLQKKLIKALIELSMKNKYQILLTTHSPALIRLFETTHINYVEQENGISKVRKFDETVADKIINTMGLLPNLGKVIICVEGTNDEKYLININQNIEELKEIINLQEKIDSGLLAIIPMHGSNLKDWINRYAIKNTNAIEFHLYDRDIDEKFKDNIEKVNNRGDGSFGTLTNMREIENYIHKGVLEKEFNINIEINPGENWADIDIPGRIKSILDNRDIKSIKRQICNCCSKKMTKNLFQELGVREEVEGWFKKIKEMVDKCVQYRKN